MNNMQALVDGLSQQWQRERMETQMTLGKLIARLEELPPELCMEGLEAPHSYRGYYCDLAFENWSVSSVGETRDTCKRAMGQVYSGYKGGDYMMGANTPVWVAMYGACGKKLVGVKDDGQLELVEDDL